MSLIHVPTSAQVATQKKLQHYRDYLHMQVTVVPPIVIEDTHILFNQNHHSRTNQVKAQTRQPEAL